MVREAVGRIDKDLPVFDVRTQEEQIDATLSQQRLFATLTSAFGLLALVLASVGIYGDHLGQRGQPHRRDRCSHGPGRWAIAGAADDSARGGRPGGLGVGIGVATVGWSREVRLELSLRVHAL